VPLSIDHIILAIAILNLTLLGWFSKSLIGCLWLYYKERNRIDLVIALLWGGFGLERVSAIASSIAIYTVNSPGQIIPASAYDVLFWRLVILSIENIICLIYDIIFFRYRSADAPPG